MQVREFLHMHSAPWRLTPGGGASLGPAADRVPRARRPCGLPAAQAEQLATAHTAAPPPFRRPLVRAGLTPGAPGALSAGTGMGGGRGSEEERKEAMLQEYAKMRAAAFSQVPEMDCRELLRILAAQAEGSGGGVAQRRAVVVDTRSDAECEVSMIPCGALRQSDFERRRGEFKDCTVVCYCTIGLRSGKYAGSLREKQGMDAYNLKGSILAWTHERLPLTAAYDPDRGSAFLSFPLPPPGPPEASGEGTGAGARAEAPLTTRVHVYSDKFALQADGFEPVTFPPGPMSLLGSLLPTWLIAKAASTGC